MSERGGRVGVQESLAETAARVDETLKALVPSTLSRPGRIHEAMRYSVIGSGKRLRAHLVLESAAAAGGERERALPLAAAIEMIHAYSLIHDDLPCMDDDDMRRGKPSNHIVFGEGMAVLAGDALLTHAFGILSQLPRLSGISPETTLRIIAEVAEACGTAGMIGGQTVDVEAEGAEPDAATVEYIHRNKTGALFTAAVRSGALLGGADERSLGALTRYAYHFGFAFQIVDDLLDVVGDVERLGKAVGSDERREKLTYPRVHGTDVAREAAQRHTELALYHLEALGSRGDSLRRLAEFSLVRDR